MESRKEKSSAVILPLKREINFNFAEQELLSDPLEEILGELESNTESEFQSNLTTPKAGEFCQVSSPKNNKRIHGALEELELAQRKLSFLLDEIEVFIPKRKN